MWKDSGSPRHGELANVRRWSRAQYHYALRQVKNNKDKISADNMAKALSSSKPNVFWKEVKL